MPLQVEAIPRLRQLPDKMSAEERRWLSRMVARRGGVRLPAGPPDPHDFEHMPLEDRRAVSFSTSFPATVTSKCDHVLRLELHTFVKS